MRRRVFFLGLWALWLMGCAGEFNKVYKTDDVGYR